MWYVINQSVLLRTLANREIKNISKSVEQKAAGMREYYEKTYGDPAVAQVTTGTRGNGLNLLLVNDIKTEGYVKELLQLYTESSDGKLNPSPHHLGVEAYLGIQNNETGSYFYDGTLVPKTYIPYDPSTRKIKWGEPYANKPGEALTLRQLNENVINSAPVSGGAPTTDPNKLPYNINGINPLTGGLVMNSGPSRDIGVFQINRGWFYNTGGNEGISPANINGYMASSGRKSDAYYLPDMLSAMDSSYSDMMERYDLGSVDRILTFGAYSVYHNGGSGTFDGPAAFGTAASYLKKSLPPRNATGDDKDLIRKEYRDNVIVMPRDVLMAANDKQQQISGLSHDVPSSRAIATILLLDKGYYLTPNAYNSLIGQGATNISRQAVAAWAAIRGEKVSLSELADKLRPYVKKISEVYPDYDSNTVATIYGQDDSMNNNQWGTIWKLDDTTSSVYLNKLNGKDPRVLHYTNVITAGHILDAQVTGRFVYAYTLAYAGVGVDPTNPESYMKSVGEDTFKPEGSNFSDIINKMGITDMDPRVYSMLKWGYDHSGFYYYLGGFGKTVSQENFALHKASIRFSGNTENYFYTKLYVKKDGTPADANTPNDQLLNYGKFLMDCSTLTGLSYNNTIGSDTGTVVGTTSDSQLRDNTNFITIADKSQARPGDIFVKSGHVMFYIGKNTSSQDISLSPIETKTESGARKSAATGYLWVLEASTSNQYVGIRIRPAASLSDYTLRRFKTLANS